MDYVLQKNKIIIKGNDDFDIEHILDCGQIFSYMKSEEKYIVQSGDKIAYVIPTEQGYEIETEDVKYFENFFDLKTDYKKIKEQLLRFAILEKPIKFGHGIRILKQDLWETLISFIVSQNNNIKRIKQILNKLREKLGSNMGTYYAFPTHEQMIDCTTDFFKEIGAGYRARYLRQVVHQIDETTLREWDKLDTMQLRKKLMSLQGVGGKVADCILLFGYSRKDVFPVDTWIEQMYTKYYCCTSVKVNREKIRKELTSQFVELSGYAQQYLFYYQRSGS